MLLRYPHKFYLSMADYALMPIFWGDVMIGRAPGLSSTDVKEKIGLNLMGQGGMGQAAELPPINTFLKSNPNRLTTDEDDLPELTSVGETIRPVLSEEIEAVIEEETDTETVAPAKSKTLFEKFLEKVANPQ
jgi:hypothetical protein